MSSKCCKKIHAIPPTTATTNNKQQFHKDCFCDCGKKLKRYLSVLHATRTGTKKKVRKRSGRTVDGVWAGRHVRVQSRLTAQTSQYTNERIRLPFDCRVRAHTNMQHTTRQKKNSNNSQPGAGSVRRRIKYKYQLKVFIVPHSAASKQASQRSICNHGTVQLQQM